MKLGLSLKNADCQDAKRKKSMENEDIGHKLILDSNSDAYTSEDNFCPMRVTVTKKRHRQHTRD
jgi:hypothetical protein